MSNPTVWWLLAGITVAVELATGTFYLLMISIGLVAAAVAAHLGVPMTAQIITAAVVGGGAVALWHWRDSKKPQSLHASANPDVHIDIGGQVTVTSWQADGTTNVVTYSLDDNAGGRFAMTVVGVRSDEAQAMTLAMTMSLLT